MPAEAEVKLAEKICQLMKPVERVRFVNSGSEATMTVMRAVRAYRKRDIIVKFEGAWHGLHDGVLVSTLGVEGEPHAPIAHLDCAGIPKEIARHLLILPYNEADLAAETISQHADEIAGVMVEPASGFGIGVVAGELEFLKAVREVTARYEIPLIFDEVVTNFRLALGGATEFFGVQPDLVTLGKIPGGGFAFGGYGGRQDIMEAMIAPKDGKWDFSRQVIQSGTFSGNPITTAAGLAILEELERRQDQIYPQLAKDTRELGAAIQQLADRLGFDVHVNRVASIFQVHFGTPGIRNKRDLLRADKKTADLFHLGLRAHGVMASYHPVFLSTAHTAAHHQQILEAAEQSFKLMKSAG
jgi:glutamate-1-semialdehyde 2,1-aminomutase